MKLISITIKDDSCTVKWQNANHSEWSVSSDRIMGSRFGDAVKGLAEVASKSINHDAGLMAVRSIVVSENKKGVLYVKLAGVLAAASKDGQGKPGKFSTPKIEVSLFVADKMKEMELAAEGYAMECGGE